jgi:hypothetical protein
LTSSFTSPYHVNKTMLLRYNSSINKRIKIYKNESEALYYKNKFDYLFAVIIL